MLFVCFVVRGFFVGLRHFLGYDSLSHYSFDRTFSLDPLSTIPVLLVFHRMIRIVLCFINSILKVCY